MKTTNKNLKNRNGITLIAMIITIIVLLILAGIAIAMLSGENGILTKTSQAKEETELQGALEKINLSIMASIINKSETPNMTILDKELKSYFGSKVTGDTTKGWIVTEGENKYEVTTTGEVKEYIAPVAISTLVGKTTTESKTIKVEDETELEKQIFYIPGGFKLASDSATKVDEGIVIEDANGSQFVWVPVPDAIYESKNHADLPKSETASTTQGYTYTPMAIETSAGNYSGILYKYTSSSAYLSYPTAKNFQGTSMERREPVVLQDPSWGDKATEKDRGLNLINKYITGISGDVTEEADQIKMIEKWEKQLQDEYDEMVKSVDDYGGFYVGRYETGIETITDKTTNTTTTKIVSKNADKNSATVVTSDASQEKTKTWYGLYQSQKDYAIGNGNIKSTMIWGSQYDAMMNWMAKTGETVGTGNSSKYNTEVITGKSTADVINKVYDLYGCHTEWTLEANLNNFRTLKGAFKHSPTPTFCNNSPPDGTSDSSSSRLSLYIM